MASLEKKQNWLIKCPHCGYEYHVSEIFFIESLMPKAKKIIRDESNTIIYIEAEEPDLEEWYQCDNCDKNFKASATLTFKSEVDLLEEDF